MYKCNGESMPSPANLLNKQIFYLYFTNNLFINCIKINFQYKLRS